MGAVGLLYVGAVLFVNGLALIGLVRGTSMIPMNLFVGPVAGRHAVLSDLHRPRGPGEHRRRVGLVPLRLHVPICGDEQRLQPGRTGLGWFCIFVAIAAVVYSWWNFSSYAALQLR